MMRCSHVITEAGATEAGRRGPPEGEQLKTIERVCVGMRALFVVGRERRANESQRDDGTVSWCSPCAHRERNLKPLDRNI